MAGPIPFSRSTVTRVALETFPRIALTFGRSPLQRLNRLSDYLGGDVEIWAQREDVNSGLAFGGNKTRKLEYLAADALAQGCDTLVSIGGVQSNHTRQVAAAAHLGLQCVLVQEHWVDWDEPHYETTGNIWLSRLMGAEVRLDRATFDIGFRPSWEQALADVVARGGKPYAIPAGASDHPLGGHGFAGWAFEVEDQETELGLRFDSVIVCSVTGSTQAGMIAGFTLSGRAQDVIGIDASATVEKTWEQIKRFAQYYGAVLPETGIDLTYGATTFHVATFSSSPPSARPFSGACSLKSILTYVGFSH